MGLGQTEKKLPCKYFYDTLGARLFEVITELPEYYLTRTEFDIMRTHIDEMVGLVGPQASLIEGQGSAAIAASMGLSSEVVRKRKSRALRHVRELLKENGSQNG